MMTQENFRKIVKNVLNEIPIKLKQYDIDLIFKKISKKSNYIIHSQFNDLLLEFIKKLYPDDFKKNKKYTTNYFLNILFKCYSSLLIEEKKDINDVYNFKYNTVMSLKSFVPNENQIMIMDKIVYTIFEIYKKYFTYEFSNNPKLIVKSSKNLIDFSKDFEILPFIMNETQIITYYKLVIYYEQPYKFFENDNNIGVIFTLNHFMLFIIHISLYFFTKKFENITEDIVDSNVSDESKLLLFLEKLESSHGMKNAKKILRPISGILSFIPSKDIYEKIGELDPISGKLKPNSNINILLKNN